MTTTARSTVVAVRIAIFIVLALIAFAAVAPLLYMLVNTVRTSTEYIVDPLAWPDDLTYFDNYRVLYYNFDILRLFFNTLLYITLAQLVSLVLSVPAAFAFAKTSFPHRRTLYLVMIGSLAIPPITFIVPDYVMFSRLGWVDRPWSIVLLWAATSIPPTVFLLAALMRGLPREILDASKVDGASYGRMLLGVVLPMSVPGLITVTIFNVTTWWNDLLLPLIFLQSDSNKTVTVAVAGIFGRYNGDFPLLMTGLLMASVPPIVVYVVMQRYIQRGLVIGAVK
jgi:ABC-type glycerol-3-phosphate transport system permease component